MIFLHHSPSAAAWHVHALVKERHRSREFIEFLKLLNAAYPPLSVEGRGCELIDLMCAHDLEGVVAKRFGDRYDPHVRWLKIKNPDYSQKKGRGDLFNGPRQRPCKTARSARTA